MPLISYDILNPEKIIHFLHTHPNHHWEKKNSLERALSKSHHHNPPPSGKSDNQHSVHEATSVHTLQGPNKLMILKSMSTVTSSAPSSSTVYLVTFHNFHIDLQQGVWTQCSKNTLLFPFILETHLSLVII